MTAIDIPTGRSGQGLSPGIAVPARRLPAWPVVLYLLFTVAPIFVSLGGVSLSPQRILLLILVIPLMGKIFAGHYGRVQPADYLFPLHIVWMGVALLVNNPDRMLQQTGSLGIELLGAYAVGRAYVRTTDDFRALCRFLMVIVLLMLPLAIYETLTGQSLLLKALQAIPASFSVPGVDIGKRLGLNRVQMAFAHPIHFGLFCSTTVSLVYVGLADTMPPTRRLIVTGLIVCCGFLALSSGALLAILLQIGLITWSIIFRNVKNCWWLLVGLFACAYLVIDLLSNRTPYQVFLSYATFSAGTAYWRSLIFEWGLANVIGSAEKGVIGHPIFGIGLNDWVRASFMGTSSMDNFWLVNAVRYGLPGFLLLALGYLIGIFRVMWRDFTGDVTLSNMRRAWVFTFLGLTFTLFTVHVWSALYSYVFFLFGAGMWMVTANPATDSGPAEAAPAARRTGNRFTRFPAGDPGTPPAPAPAARGPAPTRPGPARPASTDRGPRFARPRLNPGSDTP